MLGSSDCRGGPGGFSVQDLNVALLAQSDGVVSAAFRGGDVTDLSLFWGLRYCAWAEWTRVCHYVFRIGNLLARRCM